ncbi:hypothetical protein RDE2_35630 [Rhodococcus sp. RDE2]|nr:hypothetical protein RDE2_35630 [Rhodococcus sp. RDE2]
MTAASCGTATPFGRPVDPDVKITYAVLPGHNAATRSASVTGSAETPDTSSVSIARLGTDLSPGTTKPSRSQVSTTTGAAVSRM